MLVLAIVVDGQRSSQDSARAGRVLLWLLPVQLHVCILADLAVVSSVFEYGYAVRPAHKRHVVQIFIAGMHAVHWQQFTCVELMQPLHRDSVHIWGAVGFQRILSWSTAFKHTAKVVYEVMHQLVYRVFVLLMQLCKAVYVALCSCC